MTTAPQQKTESAEKDSQALKPFNTMRTFIYKNQKTLMTMMPKVLNADRFLRVAINELVKTPKLLECAPSTVLGALIQCAQFGLEPNSILGHAYLVPFFNGKKKRMECQLIPGYKGLIALARRSGEISVFDAHEVHANDVFDYEYGTDPILKHKPAASNRGAVTHYYAAARLKDGAKQFTVMSIEDVLAHKKRFSKASDNGPWVDHQDAMGLKTCARKLCKFLPASIEVQKAVMLDELAESGQPQDLGMLAVEAEAVPADDELESDQGNGSSGPDRQMETIKDQLKQSSAPAKSVNNETPEPSLSTSTRSDEVDDVRWREFIDYINDDKERRALNNQVKEKMCIEKLNELKGKERQAFILSIQDAAKRKGLPFSIFVQE